MEDGVSEDDIEAGVGKGHGLDGFEAEVSGRKVRSEMVGEGANGGDGVWAGIDGGEVEVLAQEIDEVAAGAAAGVEDAHAGADVAAEELVEEVDVDVAEGVFEGHGELEAVCCAVWHGRGEIQGSLRCGAVRLRSR